LYSLDLAVRVQLQKFGRFCASLNVSLKSLENQLAGCNMQQNGSILEIGVWVYCFEIYTIHTFIQSAPVEYADVTLGLNYSDNDKIVSALCSLCEEVDMLSQEANNEVIPALVLYNSPILNEAMMQQQRANGGV
jgi:hypothetical protein